MHHKAVWLLILILVSSLAIGSGVWMAWQADQEQTRTEARTPLANMSHEIRTPMNGVIGMKSVASES